MSKPDDKIWREFVELNDENVVARLGHYQNYGQLIGAIASALYIHRTRDLTREEGMTDLPFEIASDTVHLAEVFVGVMNGRIVEVHDTAQAEGAREVGQSAH